MEEQIRNIGLYGLRTLSHKISFSLSKETKKSASYDGFDRAEEIEEYGDEFRLEDEMTGKILDLSGQVQIDTTRTKNIVSTQINGQDSTIKEWINNSDYTMSLTISVVNDKDAYPEKRIKEIMNFLEFNRTLKVYNRHLNEILKVTRLVVMDYKHTPNTWQSCQTISVGCVSDESYIIEEEFLR